MFDKNPGQVIPAQAHQPVDAAWLAGWLKAIQEQQAKQTKYLRNISTAATLFGLLLILGVVVGGCSALMGGY